MYMATNAAKYQTTHFINKKNNTNLTFSKIKIYKEKKHDSNRALVRIII